MTMPQSATQLFDQLIPEGLKKFPEKAKEINAIYGFKVTGDGGGEWTVDLTSTRPTCLKGDGGNSQCTISVCNEDFQTMLADPQAAMQLYFQGKLLVTGDPMLAMKLQSIVDLARA